MKVLIIGATGLLGHTLYRRWSARRGWEVVGTRLSLALGGLRRFDLLEAGAASALMREARPDAVVLPASNPHVDHCETHPDETRRLNVDATLAVAHEARELGARFVFFSSDYVFDGGMDSYREEDEPRPLNEYGRQKLAVERELAGMGAGALVLRLSGLFGWELRPKNFVVRLLKELGQGRRVRVASDQYYNPTYAQDVAAVLAELLESGASGVFHAAGSERFTRAGWARAVADVFGLDASLLDAVPAEAFASPRTAKRPGSSSLDCAKAAGLLGAPLPGGRRGLERMLASRAQWEAYAAGLKESMS
ncbi:MAG: SDR family oxidoreductase [Elusimicrobiota bacterium]